MHCLATIPPFFHFLPYEYMHVYFKKDLLFGTKYWPMPETKIIYIMEINIFQMAQIS